MKGGDNNGILIHSPLAKRVGVHLKDNWTSTLTNMRQRVDIKKLDILLQCHVAYSHSNWAEGDKCKAQDGPISGRPLLLYHYSRLRR